jgi:hypothetical protein
LATILIPITCFALAASSALAHTKSTSYSRWTLDGDRAHVQLRIPLLELTRFPPDHPWPRYAADHLELLAGDRPCQPGPVEQAVQAEPGWAVFRWSVACPEDARRSIRNHLFDGVLASHLHFARVTSPTGGVIERVLVAADPVWPLGPAQGGQDTTAMGTSLVSYVVLGIEHILNGWDHLAFVGALVVLARSLHEVATLVTAFTVAHSLTLALAVLGVLRPEPASVEILIGFSIALVAAENGWLLASRDPSVPRAVVAALAVATVLAAMGSGVLGPLAWLGLAVFSFCHFRLLEVSPKVGLLRAMIAFAFGLVHGFGFAGVLMEVDLPSDRLGAALFGFNLGVELGQLGVVLLLWPALRWLARVRSGVVYSWIAESGSAAILALGLYWVVTRNWG